MNPLEVVQQKTVCKEGEILPELQIGRTDGCAGQELLFDYPDICRFPWRWRPGKSTFDIWKYTEDLEQAGYRDQVFTYDRDTQCVRFGDGIHGRTAAELSDSCDRTGVFYV